MIAADLAYTHIWGLGGDMNFTQTTLGTASTLAGTVGESIDIVSAAVKFKLSP